MEAELREMSGCACELRQRKTLSQNKPSEMSHKSKNGCEKSFNSSFKELFGFCFSDFRNWDCFVRLMNKPMDPSSLGILRILFGFMMAMDTVQERGMSFAHLRWGDSEECRFPFFSLLQPLPLRWMYMVYVLQIIGAFGIMIGLLHRISCLLFVIPYWYILLLDKTVWNNHSYLFGLFGLLLLFSDAHRYSSVDGLRRSSIRNSHVPLWTYCLFRTQIFIVYFIAGIKKLDSDWLYGYSMHNLAGHWVFSPFRVLLTKDQIDFWIVHQGGFIIDLFIGFILFFDFTRWIGLVVGSMFHVMNSLIFSIGMFPYVMLATLPLFCSPDWPKKLFGKAPSWLHLILPSIAEAQSSCCVVYSEREPVVTAIEKDVSYERTKRQANDNDKPTHHIAAAATVLYILSQFFLPFSHFLTPGYNNWTNGLYGYSWDMMVYNWNIQHVQVKYHNRDNGEIGFLNPTAWTQLNGRWSSHADMLKQLANCIDSKFKTQYNMTNTGIYIDVWKSLNDRFYQRMFDPRVDLVEAEWSPFKASSWVLPLLTDLSDWRTRLADLKNKTYNLSNTVDITFIADFPGLHLENYIQPDLDNVEIQVLSGSVVVELSDADIPKNFTLLKEEKLTIPSGQFHKVYAVSDHPSCYMYTFINKTLISLKTNEMTNSSDNQAALEEANEKETQKEKDSSLFSFEKTAKFVERKYEEFSIAFHMTMVAFVSIITGEPFEAILEKTNHNGQSESSHQ